MAISVSLQEFVIANYTGKTALFKLVGTDGDNYVALNESENLEQVTLQPSDILANLGNTPVNGKVYGTKILNAYSQRDVEGWGTVFFFRKLKKEEKKLLRTAMTTVVDSCHALGIELHPFETQIHEAKGSREGHFKFQPRTIDGVSTDSMVVNPIDFENPLPLLYHLVGHSLWHRRMLPEDWAEWLLLYHKAIALQSVNAAEIDTLIAKFVEAKTSCTAFKKSLDERNLTIFNQCLTFAKNNHLFAKKHIDTLVNSGYDVTTYLRLDTSTLLELSKLLTEVAQESPEKFFAEAFALHQTGASLSKPIEKLLTASLRKCATFDSESL